jgi:fluoroacetyl-CoA thioesterase
VRFTLFRIKTANESVHSASIRRGGVFVMSAGTKPAVSLVTLESYNHIVGDIELGVKIYQHGGIEYDEHEPNCWWVRVPHKGEHKSVVLSFSRDGQELGKYSCDCTQYDKNPPVCRHVVAATLAIQGGTAPSRVALGQSASAQTTVTSENTAKAVGSGHLEVFATPMMIALMEQAACLCLADGLQPEETSVGISVDVEHAAASPLGALITATATITSAVGRKITFAVEAHDDNNAIGKGKHSRVIVDTARFMAKLSGS